MLPWLSSYNWRKYMFPYKTRKISLDSWKQNVATFFQNVGNNLPSGAVSYPGRKESSKQKKSGNHNSRAFLSFYFCSLSWRQQNLRICKLYKNVCFVFLYYLLFNTFPLKDKVISVLHDAWRSGGTAASILTVVNVRHIKLCSKSIKKFRQIWT
jgi:hypothetical protein